MAHCINMYSDCINCRRITIRMFIVFDFYTFLTLVVTWWSVTIHRIWIGNRVYRNYTSNYSTIINLYALQITTARTKSSQLDLTLLPGSRPRRLEAISHQPPTLLTAVSRLSRLMVSQSLSLGVDPHIGLMTRYLLLFDSYGLVFRGALSDKRTGLSFVFAAGTRQRSLTGVRVPWDTWPYFTVSDLKLPFSSSPTTRRVTMEVLEPASTRVSPEKRAGFRYIASAQTAQTIPLPSLTPLPRVTWPLPSNIRFSGSTVLALSKYAAILFMRKFCNGVSWYCWD
jgi:hypothetical protein